MIIRSIDNFITKSECKHLIKLIEENNHKSTVASDATMDGYEQHNRNSTTSNLLHSDTVVNNVLSKIAEELKLDLSLAEGIQGQRYEVGQYFKPHQDWFSGKAIEKHCKGRGNRSHTLMIYLNEDFEGGKTNFPNIYYTAQPQTGRAITWTNLKKDGTGDPDALHEGQTISKGVKYIITSWWRTGIPLETTTATKTFSNDYFPTFTEKGYKIVDVPKDALELINKMWYKLKEIGPTEENFPGKENIITGYEKTSNLYTLGNVEEDRDRLHDMLLPLHQDWCGENIKKAWCYGVREYLRGADLKQHKDRIETHHISSIILVDKDLKCGCKSKVYGDDWALDFQTHNGDWEKVYLQPGQMVLYESAACSHGRNDRFEGTYYRNLFIHYTLTDWKLK